VKTDTHLICRNSACWNRVAGWSKEVEESPYES